SRPRCGSRRSTRQPTRPPPRSTGWSCDGSSATSLTSSSPGCARSPSSATSSPKPEPAALTHRAKARPGSGDVPGAASKRAAPGAPHRPAYASTAPGGPHSTEHLRCVIGLPGLDCRCSRGRLPADVSLCLGQLLELLGEELPVCFRRCEVGGTCESGLRGVSSS